MTSSELKTIVEEMEPVCPDCGDAAGVVVTREASLRATRLSLLHPKE